MKRMTALLLAAAIVFTFAGCGKKKETVAQKEVSTAVNVTVVEAAEKTIEDRVTYTGEIKASQQTGISSKASGVAKKVYKQVGDYVNAGEILLQIDDTDYRTKYNQAVAARGQAQAAYEQAAAGQKQASAAYEQANAAYNQANASYEGALATYNSVTNGTAEQTKIQLKSVLDAAEIEFNNAKQNLENQKVLYDSGAISKTVYDTAVTRYNNAKLNYDTAKSNYDLTVGVIIEENKVNAQSGVNAAESGVKSAQAGVNSAEAGVNSAKAGVNSALAALNSADVAVEAAKNALNDTVVKAPISGYIAARNTNVGQMVAPGVEIFTIKSTDSVEAQINVTESVIPSVKVGTKAQISVSAVGKESIDGVVTRFNPVKSAQTGMYQVVINIENKDNKLKEGMFADISLTLKDSADALVVASEAVMEDDNGAKYVYVAEGNKAVRKDIETGIITDEFTEVVSGVSKGDKIIVSGKDYLSEKNNKIKVVK